MLRGGRNLFNAVNCVEILVRKEDVFRLFSFGSIVASATVRLGFVVVDASVADEVVLLGDDKPASVEII